MLRCHCILYWCVLYLVLHTIPYPTTNTPPPHSGVLSRYRNKLAAVKHKLRAEAELVYEKYLKAAQTSPRGVVSKLSNIVSVINKACHKQVRDRGYWSG